MNRKKPTTHTTKSVIYSIRMILTFKQCTFGYDYATLGEF